MESLDDYTDLVREHIRSPRNAGSLDPADGTGEAENPICGDVVRFTLRLDSTRIDTARFQARGCPATLAAASWLAGYLPGTKALRLRELDPIAIERGLGGLPPGRQHGAELAARAARAALGDAERSR